MRVVKSSYFQVLCIMATISGIWLFYYGTAGAFMPHPVWYWFIYNIAGMTLFIGALLLWRRVIRTPTNFDIRGHGIPSIVYTFNLMTAFIFPAIIGTLIILLLLWTKIADLLIKNHLVPWQ